MFLILDSSLVVRIYSMQKKCYVFIDASNMFYGTPGRPNWRVDYMKLFSYLTYRYDAKQIFFYSGIETSGLDIDIPSTSSFPIKKVLAHLRRRGRSNGTVDKDNIQKYINRAKFFKKLEEFGYILRLKPIKHIRTDRGIKYKANCDVDLTFDMMRLENEYSSFILFSGDGDFELLLRYAKEKGKKFKVFSFKEKTANIIKTKYSEEYEDISILKEMLIQE